MDVERKIKNTPNILSSWYSQPGLVWAVIAPLFFLALFLPLSVGASIQGCGDQELQVAIDIGCSGEGNPIVDALGGIVRFLAAGVGLVITLMIVVGAIQYISASGNPQSVEAAKKKIFHAVEALILFIFMTAILNFVIPGGLL